jgi:gluconokinase
MVIIVMGVTGAGKTTVGKRLASVLGWQFHDADDFHPEANKIKMHAGVALNDEDRWPWLQALRAAIEQHLRDGSGAVVACSALKAVYREVLAGGLRDLRFVHLTGDRRVLEDRLGARRDHFMNPALLESQLDTLEPPADALNVDFTLDVDAQVDAIRRGLGLAPEVTSSR